MPVIPATGETEAGTMQVQSQPQKFSRALSNFSSPLLKIKKARDVAQWLRTPGSTPGTKKKSATNVTMCLF